MGGRCEKFIISFVLALLEDLLIVALLFFLCIVGLVPAAPPWAVCGATLGLTFGLGIK